MQGLDFLLVKILKNLVMPLSSHVLRGPKIWCSWKICAPKLFEIKNIYGPKIFGSKNKWVEQDIMSKRILFLFFHNVISMLVFTFLVRWKSINHGNAVLVLMFLFPPKYFLWVITCDVSNGFCRWTIKMIGENINLE